MLFSFDDEGKPGAFESDHHQRQSSEGEDSGSRGSGAPLRFHDTPPRPWTDKKLSVAKTVLLRNVYH
jgi:hypothetical protein